MTVRAIQCPGCGAAEASEPDEHRVYTCSYCGLRYDVPAKPVEAPAAATSDAKPAGGVAVAIVVLSLMIIGAGVAMVMFAGGSEEESAAAQSSTVQASPRSNSTSSAAPARPAAPEVPATATFELHGTRSGYQSSFYVLGFVTNTSAFAIRKPKLIVVLLDEQGNEVGTRDGFAEHEVLEPGERSPAKVLVKDPPAYASLTVEVVPYRSTSAARQVAGLEVEINEPQRVRPGTMSVTGRVHHRGTQAARFIRVSVLAFDDAGKLVGMDASYADAERLEPGSSARFSISTLMFDGEPTRFEARVFGRAAQ
jgi:hypothetical protein